MSLAYEVMLILFGLIMPRLIIGTYGSEVNGLTSTINHLLSILNLLQAGAVGASIFQMYKPVAEKDYYQVSMVLESSRRYFRKLGLIFLALVIVVIPIMSIGTESKLAIWEKALAFLILGVNGALYFFFTAWYDILFAPHQKRYLFSIASILDKLLYYGLLFAVILLKLHFMWMYVAVLVGTCSRVLFLHAIYRREFKPLLVKVKPNENFKIKNKGYLLCNQIAAQAVDALPSVMITSVSGLISASVYAIYTLVQNMIKMVVRTLQISVSEVFGNLVVSASEERVKRVYGLLEFVFFLAAVVLCCCASFLFMPFIYLYTNGNTLDGINYMYPVLSIAAVSYGVLYSMYMPCYTLTNVYGLFKETYLQAVICAIVSTVASLLLGIFVDWPLLVFGPLFYYFAMIIWRSVVARKKISWFRLTSFVCRMLVAILTVAVSVIVSSAVYADRYPESWFGWLVHAVLCGLTVLLVVGIYVLIFERPAAKGLIGYGKKLLAKKFGGKKKAS